jgi:hypothetical protein
MMMGTSLAGVANGYLPPLGRMMKAPATVARRQVTWACHHSVPTWPVTAGRDGALGHEAGAVGPAAPHLPDTVPVDGEAVGEMVHDVDNHRVAIGDVDRGAWELPVHHVDLGRVAQVCLVHLVHLVIIS